jgi:hypothetical protein
MYKTVPTQLALGLMIARLWVRFPSTYVAYRVHGYGDKGLRTCIMRTECFRDILFCAWPCLHHLHTNDWYIGLVHVYLHVHALCQCCMEPRLSKIYSATFPTIDFIILMKAGVTIYCHIYCTQPYRFYLYTIPL